MNNTDWQTREILMSRQADILPSSLTGSGITTLLIGCGGIGSNVARMLAGMGIGRLDVLDNDTVGLENVFPGRFNVADVGELKVVAVARALEGMGVVVNAIPKQFDIGLLMPPYNAVVVATDSLETRREVFSAMRDMASFGVELWLDGRMGGTKAEVYSFSPNQDGAIARYANTLSGGVAPLPCGQKATAMLTMGVIPGIMGCALYETFHHGQPMYFTRHYDAALGLGLSVKLEDYQQ